MVDDLKSPHPMAPRLPGIFRDIEDGNAEYRPPRLEVRMMEAFDDVLAPILATLDNLDSYIDPEEAPDDFLVWLGQLVGMPVDRTWSIERQRLAVSQAAAIYGRRGTIHGLRELVELFSGGTVEVRDNGGVASSATPGGEFPGTRTPSLSVEVRVPKSVEIDPMALDALIRAAKPAHVPHEVAIVRG